MDGSVTLLRRSVVTSAFDRAHTTSSRDYIGMPEFFRFQILAEKWSGRLVVAVDTRSASRSSRRLSQQWRLLSAVELELTSEQHQQVSPI